MFIILENKGGCNLEKMNTCSHMYVNKLLLHCNCTNQDLEATIHKQLAEVVS
jgi:hypothetical protein